MFSNAQRSMMNRRSHRRGYVLVLTLGLITLASISLAGLARHSLGLASRSQQAAEELQRRWGLLSARHVLMERADDILVSQVRPDEMNVPPWPKPANVTIAFQLGALQFSADISDEDSKLNLNTIYARGSEQIPTIIRRLSSNAKGLTLRLTPAKDSRTPFASWGQVFDLASLDSDRNRVARLSEVGRSLTCWGNGRLNLRRASDAVVREVASLVLPAQDIGQLLSIRKSWGGQSVDDLLAQLDLRAPQLSAARRLFESESRSYSVWLSIDNGSRTWSYQYVDDGGTVCFAW